MEDQRQAIQPVQDRDPAPLSTPPSQAKSYNGSSLTPAPVLPVFSVSPAEPATPVPTTPTIQTVSYYATHKEGLGGGCDGTLILSATRVEFDCTREHYSFAIDSVAGPHKDGFILKEGGKKYHFRFGQYSKEDAEQIFSDWFQKAKGNSASQTVQGTAETTQTQP